MRQFIALLLVLMLPLQSHAGHPACDGPENWAANMAFARLKRAGLTDNDKLDFSKTKVIRLASEEIGKDLYKQIHRIIFTEKLGNTIEVITSNEASNEECSMSGVEVFVISKQLGP
jgi:hypothetical protein